MPKGGKIVILRRWDWVFIETYTTLGGYPKYICKGAEVFSRIEDSQTYVKLP